MDYLTSQQASSQPAVSGVLSGSLAGGAALSGVAGGSGVGSLSSGALAALAEPPADALFCLPGGAWAHQVTHLVIVL